MFEYKTTNILQPSEYSNEFMKREFKDVMVVMGGFLDDVVSRKLTDNSSDKAKLVTETALASLKLILNLCMHDSMLDCFN